MKKIITLIMSAALVFTGCSYDDGDLWKAVDDLDGRVKTIEELVSRYNTDIASLQTLVGAIKENDFISGVKPNADGTGWIISFQSASPIEILHGSAGSDAPEIGVKADEDGVYYWTLGGDFIEPLMPVSGQKGEDGNDAAAPVVGIDEDGYWTIDTGDGNGPVRIESGGKEVKANTDGISSVFTEVKDAGGYYIFVMGDDTELKIPKASDASLMIDAYDYETFSPGQTKTFPLIMENVVNYDLMTAPSGWGWYLDKENSELEITSPATADTRNYEFVISYSGSDNITNYARLQVRVRPYEIRILSFEDKDYKGTGAPANGYWTSLVDYPQYEGPLLYDGKTAGMGTTLVNYSWADTGNTNLAAKLRGDHGAYVYDDEVLYEWFTYDYSGGGEAISNYSGYDITGADFTKQLQIPYASGRRGSENFAVHFGYRDETTYGDSLSCIYFADGVPRVVDHMWVTSTCYFLNSAIQGDSYTPALTGYVDIVAVGWPTENATDAEKKTVKFRIANGPDGLVRDWQKWETLAELGAVVKIEFNMEGSAENYGGDGAFGRPGYFAYDDVAVRF